MYIVKIIRCSDDVEEDEILCGGMDERAAERVERGVNINLDWDNYYTQLGWYPERKSSKGK